jgi:hypothetical protein
MEAYINDLVKRYYRGKNYEPYVYSEGDVE